jgi:hypothetical protein
MSKNVYVVEKESSPPPTLVLGQNSDAITGVEAQVAHLDSLEIAEGYAIAQIGTSSSCSLSCKWFVIISMYAFIRGHLKEEG